MRFSELEGRRIGVWGLGREGRAVADAIAAHLPSARLTLVNEARGGDPEALSLCEVVVRSPGVSRYRPEAEALAAAGVEMTTGTRLWFAEHPAARAIGITGTKGKSTTRLAGRAHGRAPGGLDVRLAGNIGVPLASFLGAADAAEPDLWVLELSSFQTSDLDASPSVGVLLNLYREHTDWHGTPERYRADKLNLFAHRADMRSVLNAADPVVREEGPALPHPSWFRDPAGFDAGPGGVTRAGAPVLAREDVPLVGDHNLDNVCAALAALEAAGVAVPDPAAALEGFRPLAHRLEPLGERGGVLWVNDSIATIPEATVAAARALAPRPTVILVGGRDRAQDYRPLADYLAAGAAVAGWSPCRPTGPAILERVTRAAPRPDGRGRLPRGRRRAGPGHGPAGRRRAALARGAERRRLRRLRRPRRRVPGAGRRRLGGLSGAGGQGGHRTRRRPSNRGRRSHRTTRRWAPTGVADASAARPERLLAAVVLALVCFGLVMVFSTSSATALLNDGDPLGLAHPPGGVCARGARRLRRRWCACSPRRCAASARWPSGSRCFLLLVVLVPSFGSSVNGSRRWIALGGLGQICSRRSWPRWRSPSGWPRRSFARPGGCARRRGLVPFLGVTGVLALLILIEPDMGTAVSLCAVAFAMLIVAGARMRHLGALVGVCLMLATIAMLAEPYRRERFFTFLDPWSDPNGAGFQSVQAQVAIGSGGLHGVGLGDGVQKAFYLPEAHTDMILATVGEELGVIGVLGGAGGLRPLRRWPATASRIGARDLHQQVLAAGLTTLVVMQAVINIGAVVGVLPVTGVPLPFVSFGGSSLIILLAASGLLVNIGRRSSSRAIPSALPARAG